MTHLKTILTRQNRHWSLRLRDNFNLNQSTPVWLTPPLLLNETAGKSIQALIIDLSESPDLDACGLTFLVGIKNICSLKGIDVVLENSTVHLHRLLRIMKFDQIFVIEAAKKD